ncbi:hypothetical protein GCM10009868_22890 [Terrabacter aerolatus]|uniref:Bacteriocin biosynthesis cyclodehydratase domain-containing protein n=1 Tax=Terrabacter aerolatus TaxID=422442 RepID=A0A512D1Q6_9MICO|nr:hypothetical protein [Terrabacter aerolatus]GEO30391.1 hypothetical protein TAE01_22010 [Terrabacter aerolatus]
MSAAAVPPHPRLPAWLRPLTRRPGEVQFGVLPGGPVVTGMSDAEVGLLARLDGALPLSVTDRVAADAGVGMARWRALLELTSDLGLLTEGTTHAPVGERAPRGRVVVDGCGEVASGIADALVRTGTTVVHGRAAVDRAVASPERPRPDLVVIVGSPVVDPRRGELWRRHGVPHLPVAPAGPRTVVGPLVDDSAGAPCLWCLERHRADRDEAWPAVMSQATPARALALAGPSEGSHDALSPGLSHLVVGSVTLLVTGLLEGHPPPPGVSVEVSLPWPRMDHRRWPTHPLCPEHPSDQALRAHLPATAAPGGPGHRTDEPLRRGA